MQWFKARKFSITLFLSIMTVLICGLVMLGGDSWGQGQDRSFEGERTERDDQELGDQDWDYWPGETVMIPHTYWDFDRVRVEDLNVEGDLIFNWSYDSGWVSINEDQTLTLTHSLGGDADKYIVFMIGTEDSSGTHRTPVHHANYGTTHPTTIPDCWLGCEWHDLTTSSIKVTRGNCDNDSSNDWDYVRVRILARQ